MISYTDQYLDKPITTKVDTDESLRGMRLVLHFLLPALAWLLGFVFITKPISIALNLPSAFALLMTVALIVVPVELGWLFYIGFRKHKRFTLEGVVLYSESLSWRSYLVLLPVVLSLMICGLILGSAGDEWVYHHLFVNWWSDFLRYEDIPSNASVEIQRFVLLLSLIFTGIIAPFVEELYFRGYILPRQRHQGCLAPVINSVLFALYHVLTPWFFVSRTIAMVIVAMFVQWKRNVYLSIIVHVAVNSLFIIVALVATFFA